MVDGTVRDIAVVSTMNNLVWCYDANDSDILWVQKLAVPVNGGSSIDMHVINDHWGVLSTGIIDPDTHRWYGVAWTSPDGDPKKGMHHVHVLNLKDGSRAHEPLSLTEKSMLRGTAFLRRNSTVPCASSGLRC